MQSLVLRCLFLCILVRSEKTLRTELIAATQKFSGMLKFLSLDLNSVVTSKIELNETQCNEDITRLWRDWKKQEIWASEMIDASGKLLAGMRSGNRIDLGHYDQCLRVRAYNFTGQYCLISMNQTKRPNWHDDPVVWHRYPMAYHGICVPSSCPQEYIERYLQNMQWKLIQTNLNEVLSIAIEKGNCHTAGEQIPWTPLNKMTLYIIWMVSGVTFLSTMIDFWRNDSNKKEKSLLIAFSLISNGKKLFENERPVIKSINGLRALPALWVIYCHFITLSFHGNTTNGRLLNKITNGREGNYQFILFRNGSNTVVTFLVLAGAVRVISFYNEIYKKKCFDPILAIVQRYFRIIVPLAFILLLRMGISDHYNTGPLYNAFNRYFTKSCTKTWHTLLLGLDNFYTPRVFESCFIHTWYIALDQQLYLFSQLILVAALWKPNIIPKVSLICCWISLLIDFVVGYIYDMGTTLLTTRGLEMHDYEYALPHTRGAPWFVGMVLGCIIVDYKHTKKVVSKRMQIIMWTACILLIAWIFEAATQFNAITYTQPSAAFYQSFHKLGWSLAISWVIFACFMGIGGPLEKILSCGLLSFLGEISYELYLVHVPVIEYVIASAKEVITITEERALYHFFALSAYSTIAATILALFISIPCNNIINILTKDTKILPLPLKGSLESEKPKGKEVNQQEKSHKER